MALPDCFIEFQAEQFLAFYKKQNPSEDMETCFNSWAASKDFQKEDFEAILGKVKNKKKTK